MKKYIIHLLTQIIVCVITVLVYERYDNKCMEFSHQIKFIVARMEMDQYIMFTGNGKFGPADTNPGKNLIIISDKVE